MNLHSAAPTDPDAFLRWNEGREGKYELVRGQIIEMMTGATWGHVRIVRNLARMLEDALDPARFEVATNDIGVKTPDGVRYPDVIVDLLGAKSNDLVAEAPALIAEVLSPSSKRIDLNDKAQDYTGLATLQAYLVLSQDEPRAWLWLRDSGGWTGPTVIEGRETAVEVASMDVAIPLGRLYPHSAAS